MRMILDLFSGGHSVTVVKDEGITSASASSTTDVQKDAEVTLTVTPATNYAIGEYEVLAGGVTVDPATKKFTMGEKDVVIAVKSKKANAYVVTEECMIEVNNAKTVFHANTKVILSKNGVPMDVEVANGGTVIPMSDAVQNLIDANILIPI